MHRPDPTMHSCVTQPFCEAKVCGAMTVMSDLTAGEQRNRDVRERLARGGAIDRTQEIGMVG